MFVNPLVTSQATEIKTVNPYALIAIPRKILSKKDLNAKYSKIMT